MQADAEKHADEDKKKKELADARNNADHFIALADKALADAGDKVPADTATGVRGKIDALKKALEGTDIATITTATTELSNEMQKIGEAMSKAAPEQAAPAEGEAPKEEAPTDVKSEENNNKS
jgi:molecular chaperone DnaK